MKNQIYDASFQIPISSKITAMTAIDNSIIVFGDNSGYLYLMNIKANILFFWIKTNLSSITDLLPLPSRMLLSSSSTGRMNLWVFFNNSLFLLHSYEFSYYSILQSIYIPENKIGSFCIDGSVIVWTFDIKTVILDCDVMDISNYCNGCIAYSQKHNTLIKIARGNLFFISMNPYQKEKEVIRNVNVDKKTSVCITKEENLIVEDVELKIFIINVKTRQVESIFMNNQDMSSFSSLGISPFIVDYEHSVLFFSPCGNLQIYDKNKTTIKVLYKFKHKTECIMNICDTNEYIFLSDNNTINITRINVQDSVTKKNITVFNALLNFNISDLIETDIKLEVMRLKMFGFSLKSNPEIRSKFWLISY